MEFLIEIGLFALKTAFIVVAISAVIILIAQLAANRGGRDRAPIELEKLNHRMRGVQRRLQAQLLSKKQRKLLAKQDKKSDKKEPVDGPRVFVVDFIGDVRASATTNLREEVTAIISVAKPGDEVVVRLESGGGMVTSYGLASSQLARLKDHGLKLTICVDKVAASGGYMMACVAEQILAAPFAVVGSIGVIAQVPNFSRILKKHDVDYREVTAGEFKRTVTIFGEITPPGFEKFKEQIEETHVLFKKFIAQNRPKLDLAKVATGEHWYGTVGLELGLVDGISTSDEYLYKKLETHDLYQVKYHTRKKVSERLAESFAKISETVFFHMWNEIEKSRY
jgi:serine protease SohB